MSDSSNNRKGEKNETDSNAYLMTTRTKQANDSSTTTDSDSTSDIEAPTKTMPTKPQPNEPMLQEALEQVGLVSRGTVMMELWVFDTPTNPFSLARQAWWIDPSYKCRQCSCCPSTATTCAICALVDETKHQYIPADPVSIGEGLPGSLWASATTGGGLSRRAESLNHSRHSQTSLGTTSSALSIASRSTFHHLFPNTTAASVTWRHLRSLAVDPDQAWNPRMAASAQLPGVEWVTGIPFSFGREHRGILVVLSEGESLSSLCSALSQEFLFMSAQHVGSLYCWRRMQARYEQGEEAATTGFNKSGLSIITDLDQLSHHRKQHDHKQTLQEEVIMEELEGATELQLADSFDRERSFCGLFWQDMGNRICTVASKSKGAGNPIPPPMITSESFITFVGVFWTLLLLTLLNIVIEQTIGNTFKIVLG